MFNVDGNSIPVSTEITHKLAVAFMDYLQKENNTSENNNTSKYLSGKVLLDVQLGNNINVNTTY